MLRDVVEILLDGGVYEDFVNSDGKIVMDVVGIDEVRRIFFVKSRLELKCIVVRVVRKFGLFYFGVVFKIVEKFISLY